MKLNIVKDELDLRALAQLIKNKDRARPICLVSTPVSSTTPAFDMDALAKDAGDLADIYVIQTGELTWKLARELSSKVTVFNGAAKVIPADWQESEDIPRVFYCTENFKAGDTQSLIDHIWKFADDADLQKYIHVKTVPATATIQRIMGSRAFVRLPNASLATIRQELTTPGFPLDWAFEEGDVVEGKLNESERLFLPDTKQLSLASIVDAYGFGNLVLVLITRTERKTGSAMIFPGLEVEFALPEISGNDLDLVTDFLSVGQVVAMRLYRDAQGRTRLKMNDIDDDEVPIEALSFLGNGRPWLKEERDIPIETVEIEDTPDLSDALLPQMADDPTVVEKPQGPPKPHPGKYSSPNTQPVPVLTGRSEDLWRGYTKGLKASIETLNRELKIVRQSETAALRQIESMKTQLSEMARSNAKARRKTAAKDPNKSTTRSRRERWNNNEDWFNEELRRVWISRYMQDERENLFPLIREKYSFGPNFFETVLDESLTEDELRKAVRVIVDIVTGREATSRQNSVHALRETEAASAPIRVREDNATAWRANIEQNTPQARRLHFWKLTNGDIELAKIVKHDDSTI